MGKYIHQVANLKNYLKDRKMKANALINTFKQRITDYNDRVNQHNTQIQSELDSVAHTVNKTILIEKMDELRSQLADMEESLNTRNSDLKANLSHANNQLNIERGAEGLNDPVQASITAVRGKIGSDYTS